MKKASWTIHYKGRVTITAMALLSLIFCAAVAWAVDDDDDNQTGWFIPKGTVAKNFYYGVGAGLAQNNSPDSNQDGSVTGVGTDESDNVWSFFLGYQILENLAVQGGYVDLGESEFAGNSSGGPSWAAGAVKTEQDADAWELGVMGRWPISARWYALGFIGWSWWESSETYYESVGITSIKESGSDVVYALGFEFDHGLKDRIVYRFMGEHHQAGNDDYDINSASAAIVYRFP
jgi:OOP family OmpA-OmpF porin